MTSIYFHEDDYCQIEILPIENFEFCLGQAGLIDEFADKHRSGIGYTDVFLRSENPKSLLEKNISIEAFEKILKGHLPMFDEVYTGYSSYREKSESTKAFGFDENVVFFYESDVNIVNNIWLTLNIKKDSDISVVLDAFNALSGLGEFIITDWGWSFIEKLKNIERIEHYLHKRLEVFSLIH